jgi:transposase
MRLYSGFDLHSNNCYLGVLDETGKRVAKKKLDNEPQPILRALDPYRQDLTGIVVESTYNWYWLVDLLMDEGYKVPLATPSAIQTYRGITHVDDTHDAFWLAEMLRLHILPEGSVYPKETRPIRDLLRKRGHLVRLRTSLIIRLQNIVARTCGVRLKANEIKRFRDDCIRPFLADNEDLALAGIVSKESIDFLTRQIRQIERVVEDRVDLAGVYHYVLTIPGVGKILALTIMLETGSIERFAKVGNYASYCRKVSSRWTSNGKTKGRGNDKNGNKYLAWAFSEAAELARRFDPQARADYQRKRQKTQTQVAHGALAHKRVRAAYYVIRDQVPFVPEKRFT